MTIIILIKFCGVVCEKYSTLFNMEGKSPSTNMRFIKKFIYKILVLYQKLVYYRYIYERDVRNMIDNNTQFFKAQPEKTISVEGILEQVYLALKEKGYNPVNQIVGYIMSGDPTYITSHNNARSLIMKAERDELVEEVIRYFIAGKGL